MELSVGEDGCALVPIPRTIAVAKQPGFFGSRPPQRVRQRFCTWIRARSSCKTDEENEKAAGGLALNNEHEVNRASRRLSHSDDLAHSTRRVRAGSAEVTGSRGKPTGLSHKEAASSTVGYARSGGVGCKRSPPRPPNPQTH
ncbi:hypothetical protein MRX96_002846 [Rhipicephalus microplus]